ncbi:NAD(P)-dependent oxidoreductase [Actinomadura craniellae]|uniref:NAD(P)-dependent oxidoreductase n=1 Tax=Actinomadura craniellae TaxID=2231787 RepID=A0A365H7J8_9ACTN|nr:NAD(P)-binding domain-containing protein [Actinomadura craniellae]RAY15051.1 NAD(P)-dependent oxidoreductase [Actinomadura craniellae]
MTTATGTTMLGLGAMGRALVAALLKAGHPVTVWNRTPGRAGELIERGAVEAGTVHEAVTAGGPVVVCLYDHASVRQTLTPVADALRGRTVVNLTTTTPGEARELAAWAEERGVAYLDGAIMAIPPMIGAPGAQILYSGDREVFDRYRDLFDLWAASTYDGADAGLASLFDLAILSGMYPLFSGFLQGAAMVRTAGVTAAEFAERAAPFLAAMTGSFAHTAQLVDRGDYSAPVQSLDWTITALETIARAGREQGVAPIPVDMVTALVRQQIDQGHGSEGFDRIIEGMRPA